MPYVLGGSGGPDASVLSVLGEPGRPDVANAPKVPNVPNVLGGPALTTSRAYARTYVRNVPGPRPPVPGPRFRPRPPAPRPRGAAPGPRAGGWVGGGQVAGRRAMVFFFLFCPKAARHNKAWIGK